MFGTVIVKDHVIGKDRYSICSHSTSERYHLVKLGCVYSRFLRFSNLHFGYLFALSTIVIEN